MEKTPPKEEIVLGTEELKGLPFLRNLVIMLYSEWANDPDPGVTGFMVSLTEVFKLPLVNFDDAYKTFNAVLTNGPGSNSHSDYWRIFQMTVFTELGEDRASIFESFKSMVMRIMTDMTKGGQHLYPQGLSVAGTKVFCPEITTNLDYLILLAVRVYLGSVRATRDMAGLLKGQLNEP